MRLQHLVAVLALAGCSVPDKQPLADGGPGGDGSTPAGVPDTTITEAPAELSNAATATFRFTSNLPDARFECSVDGHQFAECSSPFAMTLGDGSHSFSVRAINRDGDGDDTPAEHLWSIDTVAPTTTLTERPPAADNSTMVTFSFTSNEMNVGFECSLDNASFMPCRSGDPFGPIGDGAHAFAVRAMDRAGNVDASPAIHAWSVDTSTPDTQLLSGPSAAVASRSATFSFVSPDAGPGATFQCALDGGPWLPCVSPQTYTNLSMAVHTFAVRVRDAVGNLDPTPATRTWTVDFTAPETMLLSGPRGTVAIASASFTFTANEANVVFACSLDGAPFAPCTSPLGVTGLAQGEHRFAVQASDAAGNTDASPATASWTVDTVAPDIVIVSGPDSGSTSGPRIVFMFTVGEGTVECRIDDELPWLPCGSPFGFNSAMGPRSFFIRAIDAAGNVTTVSRSWMVECSAPDPTGAAGLLHLDDGAQIEPNATGGPAATLGPTDAPEVSDPAATTARFTGGYAFTSGEGDLISWPLAAGATTSAITVELWSLPRPLPGTRDLLVSGDGRVAVRVTAVSPSTVTFSASFDGGVIHTVTSAPISADSWHHVLVSLAEPTLRLWVDGDRTEVGDVRLAMPPSLDSLRIGGNHEGTLDEVYVSLAAIADDETALARYCPAVGFSL